MAIVMAKFEGMWTTFLENKGSFEPFMDLYLDRWLHTYASFSILRAEYLVLMVVCGLCWTEIKPSL